MFFSGSVWYNTAKFCQSDSHRIKKVPHYEILQFIRQHFYWPKFSQVLFGYCSYTCGCTTNQRSGSVSSVSTSEFSGMFIAKEVDGVGDKRSGNTTVDAQALLEDFLELSLRSACFRNEAFFMIKL